MARAVMLLGCGDVGPIHGPIEHYGSLVRDTLLAADIRFAQVERVYSTRGALQPHSGGGPQPAAAGDGVGIHRLRIQHRIGGEQPRDGLGW